MKKWPFSTGQTPSDIAQATFHFGLWTGRLKIFWVSQ
jgi:hypothetical protein